MLQTMQTGNTSNDSLLGVLLLMQAKLIELHKDMAERPQATRRRPTFLDVKLEISSSNGGCVDFGFPAMQEKILCMMLFGRQKKTNSVRFFREGKFRMFFVVRVSGDDLWVGKEAQSSAHISSHSGTQAGTPCSLSPRAIAEASTGITLSRDLAVEGQQPASMKTRLARRRGI